LKEHAANAFLAVPTPLTSVATTPAFDTKFDTAVTLPVVP